MFTLMEIWDNCKQQAVFFKRRFKREFLLGILVKIPVESRISTSFFCKLYRP